MDPEREPACLPHGTNSAVQMLGNACRETASVLKTSI